MELDVLTGEMEILKVDIVYDGGIPLNPAIDLGQVYKTYFALYVYGFLGIIV